jgi:hypothetical protein
LHIDRIPRGEAVSWRTGARLKWAPERTSVGGADRAALERARRRRERVHEAEAACLVRAACDIWRAARPAPATIVDDYLSRHRGYDGTIPPTLRCAYALRHVPSGLTLPAMVAAVGVWPSREVVAVHRTYLDPETGAKASIEHVKMMLGPVAGGAVRLAACGDRLAISEGIETGLIAQHATGIATWAALSATGMEQLVLPPLPIAAEVFILTDNDTNGRGLEAAQRLARRLVPEGRTVRIAMPQLAGTDWADVLRAESCDAAA